MTGPRAPSPAPRFTFACQRSGRCCTQGEGYVWLAPEEPARLAAALGLTLEVFARRFVRRAVDPRSGRERLSLRLADGRCALLEGARHCSVYAARPEQCRTFPFWPSVLAGGDAFERARSTCPGIAVVVPDAVRARARGRLDELARRWPAPGPSCPFEDRGASVWIGGLEADRLADELAERGAEPAPEAGACPCEAGGRCTAGSARPLACRLPGAPADEHRAARDAVSAIESELGYPRAYGLLAQLLRARVSGRNSESAT